MKKPLLKGLGALSIAAVLAGCGGSMSSPLSTTTLPATQSQVISPDKCGHQHGVSVRPCKVTLTVSKPAATVTAKGPSSGTTFVVRDTRCTARNIATVTGAGSTYTVTAGTTMGSCIAKFVDKDAKGHPIGTAQLSITNQV
ncbi:MAG: hypothetical protein JOZ77_12610 [Candidatus Eremiobacteraeota bacterium]|nr:hypothetical protein [Candidatus Eremiobacteraeota bacterium]